MKRNTRIFPDCPKPLLFGHRGYSQLAPENTMESYQLCREYGIPGIELDVHLCATGELVITHDYNVERVSGYNGIVEQMSYAQICTIDVGSYKAPSFAGARIPLLKEVFESFGTEFYYDIELKEQGISDSGLVEDTLNMIDAYDLGSRCMISSFNPFSVRRFRKRCRNRIPTAVIYCISEQVPKLLQKGFGRHIAHCGILKPDHTQITGKQFTHDHTRRGYPIVTWVVDDDMEGKRLLDLGVTGIISNAPGNLLDLIATYQ